jgi:transposase
MENKGLTLTMKEKNRVEIVQAFAAGKIGAQDACRLLERSVRSVYRMKSRLFDKGIEGLIHGNKGRPSARATPESIKQRVLKLVQKKYANINDTQLCELLSRDKGICLGRETLRRFLRSYGDGPEKRTC